MKITGSVRFVVLATFICLVQNIATENVSGEKVSDLNFDFEARLDRMEQMIEEMKHDNTYVKGSPKPNNE